MKQYLLKPFSAGLKIYFILNLCGCVFLSNTAAAQQGMTNFGNIYIAGGTSVATKIPYLNYAGSGSYRNDGYFYVSSDFTNNAAGMVAGTGSTEFNGTATQSLGGTNIPQFYHFKIANASGEGLLPTAALTFNVAGDWTNNGIFSHNTGTVVFNGSGTQQIKAGTAPKTTFYNFSLGNVTDPNPITLTLLQNTDLLNVFSFLGSSASNMASGGFLTAKSSPGLTAQIADITTPAAGNLITGDVTVERYLRANKAWRFLATPIAAAGSPTVTDSWRESVSSPAGYGTQITGPAGSPTFDQYTQRGSIKYYNMAANVWTELTTPAVAVANPQGYMVFIRGDRSVVVGGTTGATNLRIKGNLLTGPQNYTVNEGKFQAVGNPYASRIDFRNITLNGITNSFIAWDPTVAGVYGYGAYKTYIPSGGNYVLSTNPAIIKNYIESGEAFFIQSVSNTNIQINENDKASGSVDASFTGSGVSAEPSFRLNLYANDVNGITYLADGILINTDANYSNTVDNKDVKKIMNSSDNISIVKGNYDLIVERHPQFNEYDTVFLNLLATHPADYHFRAEPRNMEASSVEVFLKDKFTHTDIPVSFSGNTDIPFVITADPASKAADRFLIFFKKARTPISLAVSASRNADKSITVSWKAENEFNVQHYETERSANNVSFTSIGNTFASNNSGGIAAYTRPDDASLSGDNFYRIKAVSGNGSTLYSNVVKVGPEANVALPSITVYPNPTSNRIINVHFENMPGKYSLQLLNSAGKIIYKGGMSVNGISEVKDIPLPKTAAPGNYQLKILSGKGVNEIKTIIIN